MMRATCVAMVVVVASSAWAGKKTVVLSGGDCSDPGLISAAKDFRDAASREFDGALMEPEVVLDIVRPRATRSLSDVERQVESARTLFFGGQVDRAEQLVDRALEELERASPETKPWAVTQNALVLKALIAKNLEHTKDMADAFRRIVRVDPAFKLDPDAHPPSAIAALDAVKKELARTRKTSITVRVEAGPAGTVFLDGQVMGSTPLKLDLVPGSYRVAVTSGAMVSFPHKLEVPRDTKLNVDLAFEGSISTQAPLCIAGGSEASAVKIAQLVAAEHVIFLRNVGRRGEPTILSGTFFDLASNEQQRAGSVRSEFIPGLVRFLVTGKSQPGVSKDPGVSPPLTTVEATTTKVEPVKPEPVKAEPAKTEPVKTEPVKTEPVKTEPVKTEPVKTEPTKPVAVKAEPTKVSDAPKKVATVRSEPTLTTPTRPAALTPVANETPSAARTASLVLIGVGVATAVAGGVVYLAGTINPSDTVLSMRNRYAKITEGGLKPYAEDAGKEGLNTMAAIDAHTTATVTLLGAGAGLVAGGLLGVVLFPATTNARLSVAATPAGGAISLSARF